MGAKGKGSSQPVSPFLCCAVPTFRKEQTPLIHSSRTIREPISESRWAMGHHPKPKRCNSFSLLPLMLDPDLCKIIGSQWDQSFFFFPVGPVLLLSNNHPRTIRLVKYGGKCLSLKQPLPCTRHRIEGSITSNSC